MFEILQLLPPMLKKKAMAVRARCVEVYFLSKSHVNKQFTAKSVQRTLEEERIGSEKTILGIIRSAKDPETGQKLGFKELVANANTMLYSLFTLEILRI